MPQENAIEQNVYRFSNPQPPIMNFFKGLSSEAINWIVVNQSDIPKICLTTTFNNTSKKIRSIAGLLLLYEPGHACHLCKELLEVWKFYRLLSVNLETMVSFLWDLQVHF